MINWETLGNDIKTVRFMLWTLPFIWLCVLLNMAGMLLCIAIGSPILFFDMTGTAVASLSRGLGYGVFVGLASNFAGAVILPPLTGFDPQVYMWFGFTNAVGAVVWAVAPHVIVRYQAWRNKTYPDFFSTNPEVGYRTLLFQIVIVGTIAGIVVGLFGIATQMFALSCTPQNNMDLCLQANPAVRSGYIISRFFHSGGAVDAFLPPLSLIAFNILDKTIATASAMMLIFIFCDVPNYNVQLEKLKKYRGHRTWEPKSFRIARFAYILCLLLFGLLYWRVLIAHLPATDFRKLAALVVALALLATLLLRGTGIPFHNLFYRNNSANERIYHDKSLIAPQSVHRDVFEDILKTIVIAVTVVNLAIGRIQNQLAMAGSLERDISGSNVYLQVFPTGDDAVSTAGQVLISLAAPIVFLNLWRYFIVFLARYWGVVYRDAEQPRIYEWLKIPLKWSMRVLAILFLVFLVVRAW